MLVETNDQVTESKDGNLKIKTETMKVDERIKAIWGRVHYKHRNGKIMEVLVKGCNDKIGEQI